MISFCRRTFEGIKRFKDITFREETLKNIHRVERRGMRAALSWLPVCVRDWRGLKKQTNHLQRAHLLLSLS